MKPNLHFFTGAFLTLSGNAAKAIAISAIRKARFLPVFAMGHILP
jgi:hypothetical protein